MKKIVISLLVTIGTFLLVINGSVLRAAESDLIELYPYDNINNMTEDKPIQQGVRTGKSNWTLTFNGYRYHGVRSSTWYAKDFDDENLNGTIEADEINASLSWPSFGAIWVNDTEEDFTLKTNGNRSDFTSVVHYIWAYFDESGRAAMLEDTINQYWIVDEGAAGYRMATVEESTAWSVEGAEVPTKALHSQIRIIADPTSDKGYLVEPIGYIKWNNSQSGEDVLSTILPEGQNPSDVVFKSGYTILSFGTLDRDGSNKKTIELIKSIPNAIVKGEEKAITKYEEQAPTFGDSLVHLDKDSAQPGINYVIEVNSEFQMNELIAGVNATYTNMYDSEGKIQDKLGYANYTIDVVKNDEVLETITMTYDSETKTYNKDKDITTIKTNVFGDGFTLVYKSVSPVNKDLVTEREVDVVIGVFSPKFNGVPKTTVFLPEGEAIYDLLNPSASVNITADNGYGADITDTVITKTNGFNQFNPTPGRYTVDLEFTYNYFLAGIKPVVEFKNAGGTTVTQAYDGFNKAHIGTNAAPTHIYDKQGYADIVAKWDSMAWTSEMLIIEDGKVVMAYSRGTNKLMNEANPLATKDALNTNAVGDQWYKTFELKENQLAVVIQGTAGIAINPWAKAVEYGTEFNVVMEVEDIDHDFNIKSSYTIVIDDITAPNLLVLNKNLKVNAGSSLTNEELIRSNVIVMDNFDENASLLIADQGGLDLETPGEYEITVRATDATGNNSANAKFKITVVENEQVSNDELANMNDNIDKLKKQNTTTLIVAIVLSVVLSGASFAAAFFLGRKK